MQRDSRGALRAEAADRSWSPAHGQVQPGHVILDGLAGPKATVHMFGIQATLEVSATHERIVWSSGASWVRSASNATKRAFATRSHSLGGMRLVMRSKQDRAAEVEQLMPLMSSCVRAKAGVYELEVWLDIEGNILIFSKDYQIYDNI